MSPRHVGLLIIRAWVERGSAKPLRANLRLTTDVALGPQRAIDLVDAEGVVRAVQEWLQAVELADADDAAAQRPDR